LIRTGDVVRPMRQHRKSQPTDDALDALGDVQRRLLVAPLDHNPQDDAPIAAAGDDADAVERLVTMRHVHLPKLADYGYVDWDRETDDVTRGPNFDEIQPPLELLDDNENELPSAWR